MTTLSCVFNYLIDIKNCNLHNPDKLTVSKEIFPLEGPSTGSEVEKYACVEIKLPATKVNPGKCRLCARKKGVNILVIDQWSDFELF